MAIMGHLFVILVSRMGVVLYIQFYTSMGQSFLTNERCFVTNFLFFLFSLTWTSKIHFHPFTFCKMPKIMSPVPRDPIHADVQEWFICAEQGKKWGCTLVTACFCELSLKRGDLRMFLFTQVFETKGPFGAAPHRKQV